MQQNIVIAVDHSPQAINAVNFYLERIHRPGNKVLLVYCIELPELDKARDNHMSPGMLALMWRQQEAKTKELEEKMKTMLQEKRVPGVLRTTVGRPGEVICRIAAEENAVMIVAGTRGMGKVRRTLLGSVADYLLNHAVCPVTVCRDPEEVIRKTRHASADRVRKTRHLSGESINALTTRIRHRFASGGKCISGSPSSGSDQSELVNQTERDTGHDDI